MSITPLLNHCFYKCQVPLAIESAPGFGKTARITSWCETNKIPLVTIPASSMNKVNYEGVKTTDASVTVPLVLHRAESLKDRGVLFIDELDTASKEVQRALIGFVESRRLPNGEKLGDGVLIVTALIPPEINGGHEILPDLKALFMWCKLKDSTEGFLAWLTGQEKEIDNTPAPAKYVTMDEWLKRFSEDPSFEADKKALLKKAICKGFDLIADENAAVSDYPRTLKNLLYWCENTEEMAKWAAGCLDKNNASVLAAVSLEADQD